jgi:hypothetical protein
MTEDQITAAVLEHWKVAGVPGSLVASCPNRRAFGQIGLMAGLPDLIVFSPLLGEKTGWLELKREGGKLSLHQVTIIATMRALGIPHAVCYGRDEPIKVLRQWGAIR